jgi:tetratricopeptide (TPR) repeat protein
MGFRFLPDADSPMTASPSPTSSPSLFGNSDRPPNWVALGIVGAVAIAAALVIRANLPKKQASRPPDQVWNEMQLEARRLIGQGALEPAQKIAESAIPLAQKTFGEIHPTVAESFTTLADTLSGQGRYPLAEPYYSMALEMYIKLYGPRSSEAAIGAGNYALNLMKEERYPEAKRLFDLAVAIQEQIAGPDHVDTAMALNNLAVMYSTMDDPATAQPLYERALAIRLRETGPASRLTAASRSNLAACLRRRLELGEIPEADTKPLQARIATLYRQALATRERLLGPDHLDVSSTLVGLSALERLQANLADADLHGLGALAIREAKLGPRHVSTIAALDNLGQVRADQQINDEARRYFEFAAEMRARSLGPTHHETLESLAHFVAVLLAEKEFEAAEAPLEALIIGLERTALPRPAKLRAAFDDLGRVLAETGRGDEKQALEERATKAVAAAENRLAAMVAAAAERAKQDQQAVAAQLATAAQPLATVNPVDVKREKEKVESGAEQDPDQQNPDQELPSE